MTGTPLSIEPPEQDAWFFLNQIPYLSARRVERLLEKYGTASSILLSTQNDLIDAGISAGLAREWSRAFRSADIWRLVDQEKELAAKHGFRMITVGHPDYPQALRARNDYPLVLYVKGRWPLSDALRIGIVGTRRATQYGLDVAESFTETLVAQGVVTVSGLASGIDKVAHRVTLRLGGWTVAALGHGFGSIFPRENARLFEQIGSDGTLVSEFPYNCPPNAGQFPRRNRIIAALSRGVLVVEAGERSGSLITARFGAEMGRDVFVVPAAVTSDANSGGHRLLKHGATLVESAKDIFEAYGVCSRAVRTATETMAPERVKSCSPVEKKILEAVASEAVSVDELVATLGISVDQLANALLSLELRGSIEQKPGQTYGIRSG